ncbi:MAG: ABC transporter ATP-binding protein [Chitinophagales bacterium]
MLKTSTLEFAYDSSNRFQFPDIEANKSAHLLIIGGSGKGKTTLLHLLGGLLRPSTGKIEVENTDITQLSTKELDRFRGKYIGIVFQKSHFVASLNVKDNLLLAQYLAGEKQDLKRAKHLLERLNLGGKLNNKTSELSQGEQQRVAIARALLNKPSIILADEPTAALDDANCFEVIDLLKEQALEAEASLIIVTHDQRLKDVFGGRIVEL